ncbi:hypothetical protein, partial [Microcoleus sp. B9-D4]|uniref:hypothetical protein n=1 Tax=Microcoleus sp. B9-D4 TaxID=2818711 RepID=UPI002FD4399A
PSKKDGRDAHPTITIKIVSYLIRDPYREAHLTFKLVIEENMWAVYREQLWQQQPNLTVLIVGDEPPLQLLTSL